MQGLMAQLADEPLNADDARAGEAWSELLAARRAQWEKALKARLESAVEQFNEDYKKGFQFMQARRRLAGDHRPIRALTFRQKRGCQALQFDHGLQLLRDLR